MIKDSKLIGTVIAPPFGWSEFKVGDLFEIKHGSRLTKNFREQGPIAFVTAGQMNQGISDFISNESNQTFSGNNITIDMFGNVFFRDYSFKSDDNILIFSNDSMTKSVGLFFASVLSRLTNHKFDYSKQFRLSIASEMLIPLPITLQGEPDYEWMARYLQELENEYVQELEQSHVQELKMYLQVSGLSDTILSDEELNALDEFRGGGVPTAEFKVGDLFEIKHGSRLTKNFREQGSIAFVTAGQTNQGISDFISNESHQTFSGNNITIDMFGNVFFRDYSFKSDDNILIFSNDSMTKPVGLFFASVLSRLTNHKFDYSKQFRLSIATEMSIVLPITPKSQPDYAFMDVFIRTQEKLSIQKLDTFRQQQIQVTKSVI